MKKGAGGSNLQADAEILHCCFIEIVIRSGTVALQERWLQLLDMARS